MATLYANMVEVAAIECGQLSLNFLVQFGDEKPEQVQRIVLPIASLKELGMVFMSTSARVRVKKRGGTRAGEKGE